MQDTIIVNTGRKSEQFTTSSFKELALNEGDTTVFQMAPIVKSYSYYDEKGNTTTQEVTYQMYLRPDCSNALIVPSSVRVISTQSAESFATATVTEVDGRIPIMFPWFWLPRTGISFLDKAVDSIKSSTGVGTTTSDQ